MTAGTPDKQTPLQHTHTHRYTLTVLSVWTPSDHLCLLFLNTVCVTTVDYESLPFSHYVVFTIYANIYLSIYLFICLSVYVPPLYPSILYSIIFSVRKAYKPLKTFFFKKHSNKALSSGHSNCLVKCLV